MIVAPVKFVFCSSDNLHVSYFLSWAKMNSQGGGGGGYSGFQVTGMIEWSQKSRPKKIPGPNINPQKIPC